jgi:HAMP domain-containing protein
MHAYSRLSLSARFTLLLLLFFAISIGLSGFALYRHLTTVAEQSVSSDGLLLLHAMNAVRSYTSSQVNPLLAPLMNSQGKFIPESVPAFSARSVFNQLRQDSRYNNFSYKEASLNPTAPQDRADGWETQMLQRFINDRKKDSESGFRTLNGQLVFYNARPLVVGDPACLRCHATSDAAPPAMVARYGPIGGFGWKLNTVIAAQVVYVPAVEVYGLSQSTWLAVMLISVISFALAALAINIALRRSVIKPVDQMAVLARRISADDLDEQAPNSLANVAGRSDELGHMARLFQRMAQEVFTREQTLKRQLEELNNQIIQIDEAQKSRRVAELVETEGFRTLRARAQKMREERQKQENPGVGSDPESDPTGSR